MIIGVVPPTKRRHRVNLQLTRVSTMSTSGQRGVLAPLTNEALVDAFRRPLWLAERVREQRQNQRRRKVDSLHAPEVECIGKSKALHKQDLPAIVDVPTLRG